MVTLEFLLIINTNHRVIIFINLLQLTSHQRQGMSYITANVPFLITILRSMRT